MLTRRHLLKACAGAVGAAAGTLFYTKRIEPHWLELVHRDLDLAGLPDHLEGRTLVQLSDLHVGPQVEDSYVLETFGRDPGDSRCNASAQNPYYRAGAAVHGPFSFDKERRCEFELGRG